MLKCTLGLYRAYTEHRQEATSVTTPPIKQSADGNLLSFFTDVKDPLPSNYSPTVWVGSTDSLDRANADGGEWWDAPKSPVRRAPAKRTSVFEFDTPEHLPSSPMCPANPMHRLKGKGVCVVSSTVTPPIGYPA